MLTSLIHLWPLASRLVLATLIGSLIGTERELRGRPAGFRTHILVCLGATLVAMADSLLPTSRLGQISPAIMTGIGFLGAGAILRSDKGDVHGLTTAASVWVTAAIGLAIGYGHTSEALACVGAIIVFLTLTVAARFEAFALHRRRLGDLVIVLRPPVEGAAAGSQTEELIHLLTSLGAEIRGASTETMDVSGNNQVIRLHLFLPHGLSRDQVAANLIGNPGVLQFDWDA